MFAHFIFEEPFSRTLNAPSGTWDGPSEASKRPLQNRHWPPETCDLIFTSVDGGRRQHLIVGVENEPPGLERGVKFYIFYPLCMCHCHSVRQHFPLHPTEGPRTFLILKRSSQVSSTHTYRGRTQSCKGKRLSYL